MSQVETSSHIRRRNDHNELFISWSSSGFLGISFVVAGRFPPILPGRFDSGRVVSIGDWFGKILLFSLRRFVDKLGSSRRSLLGLFLPLTGLVPLGLFLFLLVLALCQLFELIFGQFLGFFSTFGSSGGSICRGLRR